MREIFRPKSNFFWAGSSLVLITLFFINSLVVNTSTLQIVTEFFFSGILAFAAYLIWIKPKLVLSDYGVEVVNPFHSEFIAYGDVIGLETKWALRIIHTKGEIRVWVAPANGKRRWIANQRFGTFGSTVPLSSPRGREMQSMSESLDSSSGLAAHMIRERIKRGH